VTADEVYGQDGEFRLWLESAGIAHVVAVPIAGPPVDR
jgi:hypothetical protein